MIREVNYPSVRRAVFYICFFGLLGIFLGERGGATRSSSYERLERAFEVLRSVPRGKLLINRVAKVWHLSRDSLVIDNLKLGEVSRTDTVLTRHYDPSTGVEDRERQITIYLREDQPELELTLDLAHELVHAGSRPSFDPYDSSLTAGKYIWTAIEGEGGEVDAVIAECEIGTELSTRFGTQIQRCAPYQIHNSQIDRDAVRRDFYRIGNWQSTLLKQIGLEQKLFPLLSSEKPKLYSSTGGAPYPVALMQEFEEMTKMACENSRKRIQSMPMKLHGQDSENLYSETQSTQIGIRNFLKKRCQD